MAPQFPSIQSFFPMKSSPHRPSSPTKLIPTNAISDGFTAPERSSLVSPTQIWVPDREYWQTDIIDIQPGPKCITFMGRISNFHEQSTPSKMPQAAKGCVKIIVKDDTGALTVRLWYADKDYGLRLGNLVSIWTPHVSHGGAGKLAPRTAPLFVSIFPERDRSCHFMVHVHSDEGQLCKMPLGYKEGKEIRTLMTLKNFEDGGYEIEDTRILVCVKSIGAKKQLTNKKGGISELVNVGIFDHSAEATLTLWDSTLSSVDPWEPSNTVLLLSNPGCRIDRRTYISFIQNTLVDVDPNIPDAEWLRKFAQKIIKKEHINPAFPEGLFDLRTAMTTQVRPLYNLAEVDYFVREEPTERFTGFLSVILLDLNITALLLRNMLFCNECCGVPLYANNTIGKCKQCEHAVSLRINPRLVGHIIDETGCISPGKPIWSNEAWEQLLGRTPDELASSGSELLRYLEKRLAFLRVTLVFGWANEEVSGGRLLVLGVKM